MCWRKLFLISLLICTSALPCAADSYSEVESDVRTNAQSVIQSLNTNPAAGQTIANQFHSGGTMFDDPNFKDHPWRLGNNDWERVWKVEDDHSIKKGFTEYKDECFDVQILGCCCGGNCDNCPWTFIGYWWPEVVVSLNNFCISALIGPSGSIVRDPNGTPVPNPPGYYAAGLANGNAMDFHGGCFRDSASWRAELDIILGPEIAQKIQQGFAPSGIPGGSPQELPAALRQTPHLGNSAVTSIGQGLHTGIETTNLEAHIFRPWADVQSSRGEFNPLANFAACFAPSCLKPWAGYDVWPRLMTENSKRGMQARWRLPELSRERTYSDLACNAKYRQEWNGVPEKAIISEENVPSSFVSLTENTCASYRASPEGAAALHWKNPIDEAVPGNPLGITPHSDSPLAQNCLQSEVGQVYPLTGEFQSDSEAAGTISIALRANEWASWCKWDDQLRSNIFNYKGAAYSQLHGSTLGKNTVNSNINRSSGFFWGPRNSTYLSLPTPPDKLQRIFPVKGQSDKCFTVDEADRRLRPDLFPHGLYDGSNNGETRIVVWNYRTCCVCPSCGSSGTGACIPVTE
ncbi:MAG: hypothetical protein KDD66_02090 [Bdellovibrionales bacterium]|nr:hypothetical protein [Bdellovibrionales bacterium]